ncbi:MAG: carbohydrate porin [Myxococcaceae bacterium]|nr:carbohydrate porin [Myxococcaceae bacterium]
MRTAFVTAVLSLLLVVGARAQVSEPDPRTDDAFDFMNVLAAHKLHQLHDERWNAYGQVTYISSLKLPFDASYTNLNGTPNSLSPGLEHSFTATATLYMSLRLWHGGEAFFSPEVISMHPLSNLKGLGSSIQNFELQKNGSMVPTPYVPRLYVRHTFGLGGRQIEQDSNPLQLGRRLDSRRLTVTLGKLSVLDMFDKNAFAGDLRRQFFNMAFMTYGAFDFAADARGYAYAAVLEYNHDDWAVRFGHVTPPKRPNQKPLDLRFYKYYGDQLEVEHAHELWREHGVVRLLAYRNRENMGSFAHAVAALQHSPMKNAAACPITSEPSSDYESTNATAPDLCWARKPSVKWGIGINVEQSLGYGVGFFARGMFSDGRTEVFSYTSTDRSLSLGLLAQGATWKRPRDVAGFGHAEGWISRAHARYLSLGGLDGFIGDGALSRGSERVTEVFYSVSILSSLWASVDYQHIATPAYNRARGPVDIFGVRAHAEF